MRLQDRPTLPGLGLAGTSRATTASCAARAACAPCPRAGLFPANCRLLDPTEALTVRRRRRQRTRSWCVGFESADHDLDAWMATRRGALPRPRRPRARRRLEDPQRRGSQPRGGCRRLAQGLPPGALPARRPGAAARCMTETFETAIPWDRFEDFHGHVTGAVADAVKRVCGAGQVACRFTHVYPDGPAPYYSVMAPGRRGGELEQWDEIKAAAMRGRGGRNGGTVTHHHAVGRDHRPWLRPPATRALRPSAEGHEARAGSGGRPQPRGFDRSDVRPRGSLAFAEAWVALIYRDCSPAASCAAGVGRGGRLGSGGAGLAGRRLRWVFRRGGSGSSGRAARRLLL